MRSPRLVGAVSCVALLASAAALSAHHSVVAYYDTNRPVTLKGAVTRIEWTNPHAFVYLNVRDDRGTVTTWAIETDSPNVLTRAGWTKTTLHIGDEITVSGFPAKKQPAALRLVTLTLSDGRKLKG
jgi:V8-like Glu-specific endopeptidase